MEALSAWVIELASSGGGLVGLAVLAAAAGLEYVFPPFPGDTITLFGAVLITTYGWSFGGVFAATMVGSTLGMVLNLWAGDRLRPRLDHEPVNPKAARRRRALRRAVEKFEAHGPLYLVINRFVPAARALVFVAAGCAGMRWKVALGLGVVSAAAWNLLLIGIGAAVGASWDTLVAWLVTYNKVSLAALSAIILALIAAWLIKKR